MVSYKQFYDDILTQYSYIGALPIAGYGQVMPLKGNVLEAYRESILLIQNISQDSIAFMDKKIPHGLYDMMIMSVDEKPVKSAITDLQNETTSDIFKYSYDFINFISQQENIEKFGLDDGRFHLCFNYDPDTLDRESGMFEKRFHLHMNYWTKNELDFTLIKKMEGLCFAEMRKLIDPLTLIAERILNDILYNKKMIGVILPVNAQRDVTHGLPSGLKIKYSNWGILKCPEFINEIQWLHTLIEEVYSSLFNYFFQDYKYTVTPWKRKKLKEHEEIIASLEKCDFLSSKSKEDLKLLALLLRDIPKNVMDRLKTHKEERIQMLSMGGLNYSLGMYTPQSNLLNCPIVNASPILMVIQAKLFGAIGGAGITYMDNIPMVRLHRNAREYNSHEKEMRNKFHMDYLHCLNLK